VKILLADSQPLLRDALSALLGRLDGEAAIQFASNASELSQSLADQPAPDLVLLASPLRGVATDLAISEIRESWPDTPLVVLCDTENKQDFMSIFAQGVRGCIPRNTDPEIILRAIQLILVGGTYIPPDVLELQGAPLARAGGTSGLTGRQQEVLVLLSTGLSNRQISEELGVTEGTVKLHVHAILKFLGVSNRTEAALAAMDSGLVPRFPTSRR